jgi:hypothetical protein
MLTGLFGSYRELDARDNLSVYAEAPSACGQRNGPLLSENPWFPLLAGERPFMLDPFMFRLLSLKDPEVALDLHRRLDSRYFRCVILWKPSEVADDPDWYATTHFGSGFLNRLEAAYEVGEEDGGAVVYLPRVDR